MKRHSIDVTADHCPMTFVKTKLELEKLAPGDSLEVLLKKGEPLFKEEQQQEQQNQEQQEQDQKEQEQQQQRGMVSGHYRGNTRSRVFHAPACDYAACKNCTAGFNSIGAAMRAGYKPCKKCIDR